MLSISRMRLRSGRRVSQMDGMEDDFAEVQDYEDQRSQRRFSRRLNDMRTEDSDRPRPGRRVSDIEEDPDDYDDDVFTDSQIDSYFRGGDSNNRRPTKNLISQAISHLNTLDTIDDGSYEDEPFAMRVPNVRKSPRRSMDNSTIYSPRASPPPEDTGSPPPENNNLSPPPQKFSFKSKWQKVWQGVKNLKKRVGKGQDTATEPEFYNTPRSRDEPESVRQPTRKQSNIPWNLREQTEEGESIPRKKSSWLRLGASVHRVFKGLGSTNRRLVFHLIMILTTCSLFLRRYAKYYLARDTKKRTKRSPPRGRKAEKTTPFTYLVYFVNTIAFLFLVWKAMYHFDVSFDLRREGLINCNEVNFPPASRLHAWHILPPNSENITLSEVLYRGLPIILHVRNEGSLGEQHRVNVLKSLSAHNFHVLAPVSPLTDLQTIKMWEHLAKVSNNSVYPWFDHSNIDTIKKLASTMCDQGHTPYGIVMETKKMINVRFHSMEVWSSFCKNTASDQGARPFKFLTCPTSSDEGIDMMQEDIGSCLKALESAPLLSA